jgi:ribosomal protein S25
VKKKKEKKKKKKKKEKEKKSAFVMNIVTVDSATCIDISIVSFLNK